MIKVIFFDIGGVYSHGSLINFLNKACDNLGIDRKIRWMQQWCEAETHVSLSYTPLYGGAESGGWFPAAPREEH